MRPLAGQLFFDRRSLFCIAALSAVQCRTCLMGGAPDVDIKATALPEKGRAVNFSLIIDMPDGET